MQLLLACSPVTLRYCSVLQPEDNNLFTADTYRAPFPHLLRYTLSILPCKPLHAQDGCRVHNEGLPRPLLNPGKLLRGPHPPRKSTAAQHSPAPPPSEDAHAQDNGYECDNSSAQSLHVREYSQSRALLVPSIPGQQGWASCSRVRAFGIHAHIHLFTSSSHVQVSEQSFHAWQAVSVP